MLSVAALNRRSRLTATSRTPTGSGHDAKGQPIENPAEEMNYHHHTSGGPPGWRVTLSRRAVGRLRWLAGLRLGQRLGLEIGFARSGKILEPF